MVCENNKEVDVTFAVEMDNALKGNTDQNDTGHLQFGNGGKKRKIDIAIDSISNTAKQIAAEMKETNRLAQESTNEMKEKNRLTKQAQLISLAQHLGKTDILQKMLAESFSSSAD